MGEVSLSIPAHISGQHLSGLGELLSSSTVRGIGVGNVYGSLPRGSVGHARPPWGVPEVEVEELAEYIAALHKLGIRFHWTANATWSNGLERTPEGLREIQSEFETLVGIGVDALILGNPYLLRKAREWFPWLGLVASINMRGRSILAVERLLELGADHVVVDREVNRQPDLVRALARRFGSRFSLLVNSTCIPECPFQDYHALENGLLSRMSAADKDDTSQVPSLVDPGACVDYCFEKLLIDPATILRVPWICPEDLGRYEALGVRSFKVQGRSLDPGAQLRLVQGYLEGATPGGNLMELFPGLLNALDTRRGAFGIPPECLEPFKRLSIAGIKRAGFMDSMLGGGRCCRRGCSGCRRCEDLLVELMDATQCA